MTVEGPGIQRDGWTCLRPGHWTKDGWEAIRRDDAERFRREWVLRDEHGAVDGPLRVDWPSLRSIVDYIREYPEH
jgi:hypothetical protein